MSTTREWKEIHDEEEFRTLFANAHIVRVESGYFTPPGVENGLDCDLMWELSDGSWLAMKVEIVYRGYCDTCGYSDQEKTYCWLAPLPAA